MLLHLDGKKICPEKNFETAPKKAKLDSDDGPTSSTKKNSTNKFNLFFTKVRGIPHIWNDSLLAVDIKGQKFENFFLNLNFSRILF